MNKFKIAMASAVLGAAMFAGVVPAMAATNITFLTLDGAANTSVSEGSTVSAKVTYEDTANTDVESMSWELVGSGLPQTCINVADKINSGTFSTSFDIDTTGASEGTWDVRIRAYGIDGSDASNLCETANQVDSQNFTNRITVTPSSDDTTGSGTITIGGVKMPAWVAGLIALLKPTTPPTPTPATSTACTVLASKMLGTVDNTYNQANVMLQGYLLSEGMSIPALTAGASFGFKGPQTNAALASYKAAHQCI